MFGKLWAESGAGPVADSPRTCPRCGASSVEPGRRPRESAVSRALLSGVRFYQNYISPLKMGSTCRFEPTCSAYALQVISARGAVTGIVLTLVRLSKCGPWHPGGYDPAPQFRATEDRPGCPHCTPTTTKES
ncbi:membrane protein insertion efficiency factor YidD [Corynebacterium sp. CCM 8863]|uniref:Putative membrane protein insertion efficiency factor n=1 Tax=Corynebacterium meridianum TaxID=2765363 RepID=A0A934I9G5_9CORY|nr:membrane protein insertion efficiency factor YidD [Corynebacterium meridianum]